MNLRDSVRRSLEISALLLLSLGLHAQSILTIAGGGTDDGHLATSVRLFAPNGLAFDPLGALLVVSQEDNNLRRIDLETGLITTIAGDGGDGFAGDGRLAIFASLSEPKHVAVDASGRIYIADGKNGRVRRVDPATGLITTFAGGGAPEDGIGDGGLATEAAITAPFGLAIHDGFLYISDEGFESNRIRRVNLASGIIETTAGVGTGGFSGDGGPATEAQLAAPRGLAFDAAGNLFVADSENGRVRRIDASTGTITTFAGGGADTETDGEGGPATEAYLDFPIALAFDDEGNLLITTIDSVKRVDAASGTITTLLTNLYIPSGIAARGDFFYVPDFDQHQVEQVHLQTLERTTVAGGGTFIGDGFVATTAILRSPQGVAVDDSGAFYIADQSNRAVRRVGTDGLIATVAGDGGAYSGEQEGFPALEASVGFPDDVAIHPTDQTLFIADHLNGRVWKVEEGRISTVAGGGNPPDGVGDGRPATEASVDPFGLDFDLTGNLYIADRERHRIRRVDSAGIITTVAGTGLPGEDGGLSGDGGPASAAQLFSPFDVAVADDGTMYISDTGNYVVRRVSTDGTISTWAGVPGGGETLSDGVPATEAEIEPGRIDVDADGNVYFADAGFHRIRRVAVATGILTTVAGSSSWYLEPGFSGDNGPATEAELNIQYEAGGVALHSSGDLFLADTQNNRIRAVYACRDVVTPLLDAPVDGAVSVQGSPRLSWQAVEGAFRYDVFLDTATPPDRIIASDVDGTSFIPSNLDPGVRYYWAVRAKGDPFCTPASRALSVTRTFVTSEDCNPPSPFTLTSPTAGATVSGSASLQWENAGAGSYDVYFGTTSPPPLAVTGLTSTSIGMTGLIPGATYFWTVIARAACDSARSRSTSIRSFQVSGICGGAAGFSLQSPPNGASGQSADPVLTWSTSAGAVAYDLYFGESPDPPLYRERLTTNSLALSSLPAGTTFFWRVVARGCSSSGDVSSPVFSFETDETCPSPGAPAFILTPDDVTAGATYVISWSEPPGVDPSRRYVVERSTSPSFTSTERLTTSRTETSFLAETTGPLYHRVHAVAPCAIQPGAISATLQVDIGASPANVVISRAPDAVITRLGEPLEEIRRSFVLENLGTEPVQVRIAKNEVDSIPFFTIFDPAGGGLVATLQPRVPKTFQLRFSGPPSDVAASYQGIVFAEAVEGKLPVTPSAFVNLKVGGGAGVAPRFFSGENELSHLFFPGWNGDDGSRPPVVVGISNPGSEPIDLAAEIGPELWLRLDEGWNASPIPPHATRNVRLFTDRSRAPHGSALPRYTLLTLRTQDGSSSRLLVQDNGAATVTTGRLPLPAGQESRIIPFVASRPDAVTILRISNASRQTIQAELLFTPAGADGFDAGSVTRATILIPPNDLVVLSDPLAQIFQLDSGVAGNLELRVPPETSGAVTVRAFLSETLGLGRSGFDVPVLLRGEGARRGGSLILSGISSNATTVTRLVLTETSGLDGANVRVQIVSPTGTVIGEETVTLARHGTHEVEDLLALTSLGQISGGSVRIIPETGSGSVAAISFIGRRDASDGATIVAFPEASTTPGGKASWSALGTTTSLAVPSVVNGPLSDGGSSYQTLLTLRAPANGGGTFVIQYSAPGLLAQPRQTLTLESGTSRTFTNTLQEIFGITSSLGRLRITAPIDGAVSAQIARLAGGSVAVTGSLPIFGPDTELSTAGSSARPLYLDGIDQSIGEDEGNRWILFLNELDGRGGTVNVRLYEPGNRSVPIAQRDFTIRPSEQLELDSLFDAMRLATAERNKERTNLLAVVTVTGGSARVAAVAMAIDRKTDAVKVFSFEPAGGSSLVDGRLLPATESESARRRAVRRP